MPTQENIQEENKIINLEKAAVVAERVELINVILVKADCALKPSGLKGPYELKIDYNVNVKIDDAKKNVAVIPSFVLEAYIKEDPKKEEPAFKISVSFLLNYKIGSLDGLDVEHLQAFGEANGIYNAWPYWREYVQNIAARMCLPNLIIPVFRLTGQKNRASQKIDKALPAIDQTSQKKMLKKKEIKG